MSIARLMQMARSGVVSTETLADIDITSTTYVQSSATISDGTEDYWPNGIFFKPDGTKMFVLGWLGGNNFSDILEFSLSTAWDISTISYTTKISSVTTNYGRGLAFKRDGTAFFFYDNTEIMRKYTLTTAWDISTAYLDDSVSNPFAAYTSNQPRNPFISEDGNTILLNDNGNDATYQFSLSSANNISSGVSYDATFSTSSYTTHPRCIFASSTGDQIFILGNEGTVYKFTTTDFDISSLTAEGSFVVSTQTGSGASALFMDYDNLKMYVGSSSNAIYEYNITT